MSVKVALTMWLVCSTIGGAVIALPDDGPRLFSISDAHGPSAVDAAGIAVLLGGWLFFLAALFQRRSALQHQLASRPANLFAPFAIGLSIGLVVASVAGDFGGWWIVGAVLLVGAQLWLAALANR